MSFSATPEYHRSSQPPSFHRALDSQNAEAPDRRTLDVLPHRKASVILAAIPVSARGSFTRTPVDRARPDPSTTKGRTSAASAPRRQCSHTDRVWPVHLSSAHPPRTAGVVGSAALAGSRRRAWRFPVAEALGTAGPGSGSVPREVGLQCGLPGMPSRAHRQRRSERNAQLRDRYQRLRSPSDRTDLTPRPRPLEPRGSAQRLLDDTSPGVRCLSAKSAR